MNRRLAAVSGLFAFRAMRDPAASNPMPTGAAARRVAPGQRDGLLGHLARPQPRSALRVREPRRLPRALDAGEASALLESLRSWRDRAIAGLMLFSGLRSAEVLALTVVDVDIARGWVRVTGKGGRERRVPVDAQVAGWVQTYLLAERPETTATALFVVAKGAHRGRPLTPAGLRTIFRYHRDRAGVPAAHPHALRHSFGTALAEAGVDLAVIQALLGHAHVDSASATSTWPRCGSAPPTTPPANANATSCAGWSDMPRAERRAAAVAGAAELVADYERWLAGDGRGSRCYATRRGRFWVAGPTRPRSPPNP